VTSVAAVALALLLGFTVARSIARPVMALGQAAERLGRGDLTSRVEVPATGELGVLATVFNRMAEDLSATTVSRTYLRNVIESMAGALIITDSTARIVSVNRAALELLGYDAEEELAGQPVSRIYAGTGEELGDDTAFGRLASTLGTTRGVEEQFVRRDGSQVSIAFSGAALRDERGAVQGFVCVAHDITERKKVEGTLRTFLREKELLLREVHHRVRNNLQVVSSLLDLQSGTLPDPPARKAFEESQHRIRAMALIHEQLYQSADLAHIDFRAYIEKLASHLLESYAVHPERVDLRLEVVDLPLDIDQAVPCGLIVNELVANALKHAVPEGESGQVRIGFHGTPGGGYRLLVADNGRGLKKDFDLGTSDSLGLSLVSTLAQQLEGRMQLKSNGGTECRIEFSPRRQELPVSA
jgi:PAS domain S-box-containing protein